MLQVTRWVISWKALKKGTGFLQILRLKGFDDAKILITGLKGTAFGYSSRSWRGPNQFDFFDRDSLRDLSSNMEA
jgi:hypothetical protein